MSHDVSEEDKKNQLQQRNIALRDMVLSVEEIEELNNIVQSGKARSRNVPRRIVALPNGETS